MPAATDRILKTLREREAARRTRDEAIAKAEADYRARWPVEWEAVLDDAASLAGFDERPPVKPGRRKALTSERMDELLGMPVPLFAEAVKGLAPEALDRLKVEAGKRGMAAHVVTIEKAGAP